MKEFNKEDPTTWPYPCLGERINGEILTIVKYIEGSQFPFSSKINGFTDVTFYSELPPEGWTAKGEFPRKMLVWFDESYKVREVFGKTLDHWYYTDPLTPDAVYATKRVQEIDHEQKLKELSELEEKIKSLKTELGV